MTQVSSEGEPSTESQPYKLILFVATGEPNSLQAQENLEDICKTHLQGRCTIELVDVLTDYRTALKHKVLVTPSLVLVEPAPRVQIAGTLHDRAKVCAALRLTEK